MTIAVICKQSGGVVSLLAVHIFIVFAISYMRKNLLNSTGNPCHLEGFVLEKVSWTAILQCLKLRPIGKNGAGEPTTYETFECVN